MRIQIISVKQLRENLPQIRKGLLKNKTYLLVYRSQPFARLEPVGEEVEWKTEEVLSKKLNLTLVDKLAGGLKLGKDLTPAKINQILDQRYGKVLDR